jgi:hypothetical protein
MIYILIEGVIYMKKLVLSYLVVPLLHFLPFSQSITATDSTLDEA